MAKGEPESAEVRKIKDAILAELLRAYGASGTVYQQSTDPETRRTALDMKRCCDLAINHLAPLSAHVEKLRDDLGTRFAA